MALRVISSWKEIISHLFICRLLKLKPFYHSKTCYNTLFHVHFLNFWNNGKFLNQKEYSLMGKNISLWIIFNLCIKFLQVNWRNSVNFGISTEISFLFSIEATRSEWWWIWNVQTTLWYTKTIEVRSLYQWYIMISSISWYQYHIMILMIYHDINDLLW